MLTLLEGKIEIGKSNKWCAKTQHLLFQKQAISPQFQYCDGERYPKRKLN
ncbi:hypothetical protein ABIB50_001392 [Mucilaginibacter sp. UYCu711]